MSTYSFHRMGMSTDAGIYTSTPFIAPSHLQTISCHAPTLLFACSLALSLSCSLTFTHPPTRVPTHSLTLTWSNWSYGVATISRLLKIIDLFCKRAL